MQEELNKIKDVLKDPQNLVYQINKNKKDVYFWIGGLSFILLIYLFISSKDFSFLLIISSMTQMLSFLLVFIKVRSHQTVSGLSLNSFTCYLILIIARLCSTLFYSGYLPADQAGDWFYQLNEIIAVALNALLVFSISNINRDTADTSFDEVDFKYLTFPALGLALLVHTSLNNSFITDVLWTFSMYLETVAIYPQIHLFQKKGGQVEPYTSHYVALQGLSRLFSLIFWFYTYEELNETLETSYSLFHSYCGYFIIFSQVAQLLLMVDFYYLYFRSIYRRENMNVNELYMNINYKL